jgi:nicotinamide riboside kinase
MIRIVVTGPESTGKTTLAKQLSDKLQTDLISEFAREHLADIGLDYTIDDLHVITEKHHKNISLSQNSIQIVDTDFVVMKVWYDDKFGSTPAKVIDLIGEDLFDLHILCAPDIPWEEDELREDPERRDELFNRYIEELERFRKNYIIAAGDVESRVEKSLKAINAILK